MAARLPTVGGDDGNWGQILNDFLSTTHKSDGTLNDNSVTANTIPDGAVTTAKLDSATQTSLGKADTAVQVSTNSELTVGGSGVGGTWVLPGHSASEEWVTSCYLGYHALSAARAAGGGQYMSVAIGPFALATASGGSQNTAVGVQALKQLTTGVNNVAMGQGALIAATTASTNVGIGTAAGNTLTTGSTNTLVGVLSGRAITAGNNHTAVGYNAGQSGASVNNITAVGTGVKVSVAGGIAIGIDSSGAVATSSAQDQAVIGTGLTTLSVGNPGGGQGSWKLGKRIAGAVSLDSAHYIEVMIDGTVCKILVST